MTRILMLVPAVVLVILLGACGQQEDVAPEAPAAGPATRDVPVAAQPAASEELAAKEQTQQLRCGELDVTFRPAGDAGSLEMHGLSIPLTAVEAASGARYSGSRGEEPVDFWSKGDEAQLRIGEREYPTCRQAEETTPLADYSQASSAGDDSSYRASGNEPFWSLEVAGASMELVLDAGQRRVKASPLLRISRDGVQEFMAQADTGPLQATVNPEICRDSMSGLPRPDRVDVTLGDERWSGCGGDPTSLLVGASWRIVEVDGAAVLPGVPVSLDFQSGGALSGQASCNTLNGRFSMSGEGLSLTPLAITKVACEAPILQQEQALLALLGDAPKHDFDAQGRLVIRASAGAQLLAERD